MRDTEIARLHQVARMQHRNATNTEPICALRQTQANELRITSVYNSLAAAYPAFRCRERATTSQCAEARWEHGRRPHTGIGEATERDGERQQTNRRFTLGAHKGPRAAAYDIPSWEGPHCLRSLAHVARGRIASAPVRVAGRTGYAPTCSNDCMAPDRRSLCEIRRVLFASLSAFCIDLSITYR